LIDLSLPATFLKYFGSGSFISGALICGFSFFPTIAENGGGGETDFLPNI